jgi:RNA polymerase sigma factor (sigma-70 family)
MAVETKPSIKRDILPFQLELWKNLISETPSGEYTYNSVKAMLPHLSGEITGENSKIKTSYPLVIKLRDDLWFQTEAARNKPVLISGRPLLESVIRDITEHPDYSVLPSTKLYLLFYRNASREDISRWAMKYRAPQAEVQLTTPDNFEYDYSSPPGSHSQSATKHKSTEKPDEKIPTPPNEYFKIELPNSILGYLDSADLDYVKRTALKSCGNEEIAEECADKSFIQIWTKHNDFKGGSRKAWMARITVNEVMSYYRKQTRRRVSPKPLDDFQQELSTPAHKNPEAVAQNTQLKEALDSGIFQLSPEQRAVLMKVDVEGAGYEDAAAELQIAVGTVKSRLSRARAFMREFLEQSHGISSYQQAIAY